MTKQQQSHISSIEALYQHSAPSSVSKLTISPYDLSLVKANILSQFVNIEELYLHPSAVPHSLPLAVFGWKKLHTLTLQGVHTPPLWPHLAKLPHLKVLHIQAKQLARLPYELSNCQQLRELNWLETSFKENFEGWYLLEQLPQLAWMNLLKAQFKRPVLEGLEDLQLKGLLLPKHHFSYFYKNHKAYCEELFYCYQYTAAEAKSYKKIVQLAQKKQWSWPQRALALQFLAQNQAKITALATPERVLPLTDLPILEPLRLQTIDYYTTQWAAPLPLPVTAHLAVLGKIASNKKTLKQQLQAIGWQYQAAIKASTTHVLLGQNSKGAYEAALERGLVFLSELQVLDYINSQRELYLLEEQEETPEQIQSIQELLYTGKEENISLALAFFEQGGFPKQLLTPLFFAYNMVGNITLRKEIGQLLRQYAPPAVVALIAKVLVGLYQAVTEEHLKKHLQQVQQQTSLETLELAQAIYQTTGHGLTFLLQVLPFEEQVQLLRDLLEDRTLHLSSLGLKAVPAAVYALKELEELNVYNNNLKTIPISKLQQLPKLKCINAPYNYDLNRNKEWLAQIKTALPHVQVDF